MTIETISPAKPHGGVQGVYRHTSAETKTSIHIALGVRFDGAKEVSLKQTAEAFYNYYDMKLDDRR